MMGRLEATPEAIEVGDEAEAVTMTEDTHVAVETATITVADAVDALALARHIATAVATIATEETAVTDQIATAAVVEMMIRIEEMARRSSTKMSETAVQSLCSSSQLVCGLVS